jgi:hypothetical protein
MPTLGEEADITGRSGTNIEHAEGLFCFQSFCDLGHGARTPGESLLRLGSGAGTGVLRKIFIVAE